MGALLALPSPGAHAQVGRSPNPLAEALASEDAQAIAAAVAEQNRALGRTAGMPDVTDRRVPIPPSGRWLSPEEARVGWLPWIDRVEAARWWKIGLDPTRLDRALREPAAVVAGSLAAHRAGLAGADRALAQARDAADFLLWAQAEAGTGVFPFPAARGVTRDNAFVAADRYLRQAARAGRLDQVVRAGWAVQDDGDGGLQFDNGECGVAVLELYEATQQAKYRDAGLRAADGALSRPLVTNWNYTSFSVFLLARAHRATGQPAYLEAAVKKATLGVIPGQLTEGPQAGRWNDPHNARPAYHYIMLRALAALVTRMPPADAQRHAVRTALALGLGNRNRDIVERGAATKNKAIEALIAVERAFAGEQAFLRETASSEALERLGRLVSEQSRRGHSPTGPAEWGQFLEHVRWRAAR